MNCSSTSASRCTTVRTAPRGRSASVEQDDPQSTRLWKLVWADEHLDSAGAARDAPEQAVEECDVYQASPAGGLMLDENRSFSSDPDSDIAREFWWIDGEPCAHGCVVPLGNHSVSLEVHDERGAVHRTPDLWVQVNSGAACIET